MQQRVNFRLFSSEYGQGNIVLVCLVALTALLLGYIVATKQIGSTQEAKQKKADLSFIKDLQLKDPIGQPIVLSQQMRQRSVINYWATWCAPCRREMPALQGFFDAHKDKGVTVLGFTLDDAEPTERFIQELGISYPILMMGEQGWDLLSQSGNTKGLLPYTVLIDEHGQVLETKLGEIDMEMLLSWLEKHPISSK